jgi:holo-[acyl-carrier protein] synthase
MNLIKGVGIDITKIPRFSRLLEQKYLNNFLNKALHPIEIQEIQNLKSNDLKARYLASRWSFKEALVKATGDKQIIFSKVYLKKEQTGKPFITFEDEYLKNNKKIEEIQDRLHVSISHEDDTAVAIVIIENTLNEIKGQQKNI